jgi:DNA-binding CsgD family transcriptional regulator/tetratricopeptide (TPR) repeat protein
MSVQLLERGPIQVELSHLLHEAAAGQGGLVFLGGEAGIGKTSLVQRFAQVVGARARVLAGACDPLSTPRPLGPVFDMQSQLSRRYAELLEHHTDRDVLFRGFLAELSAGDAPALVTVDDAHWADEATLDLLRFLARRVGSVPALVIATYRSDEVGDRHPLRVVLGDLATLRAVQRLTLEPLSLAAVRTLASGSGLDPVDLHRQTGGNPFYVTEVIAAAGTGIPATVRDAVLARATRLPPDSRDMLDAAAVLGFRFEPWLLEAAVQVGPGALAACLAGGMLRAEGDRLAFRHELAREAILEVLPPHRRLALHRAALEALRASAENAVDFGRLAHHAEGAGDAEAVLEYAPQAARRARALSAHREAAAQYARALRFADRLPPVERAQLLEEYSWESAATDRYDEAIRADYELIELWRAEGNRLKEGWAHHFLSGCLVSVGRNVDAEEASRTAIEILESLPPGPELAEAYAGQAGLRMLNRDNAEAIEWAERALQLAEPGGYLRTRVLAYNRLGSAKIVSGDADGEQFLLRSLDLAREANLSWEAAGAYVNLGSAWGEWYEFTRAESYLAEGIAFAAERELDGHLAYMLAWQALVQLYLGRWPEAEESARRVTQRSSASAISRIMALVALGRLLVRRGESQATEVLDEALALARPTGTLQRLAPVRAARAEAAWLAGDRERSREEACSALELALEHRHPWFAGELLFWLARSGEDIRAPEWIAGPFRLQIAGWWEQAAAEWKRRGCVYEAAQALAETDEPARLRQAFTEFRNLGAPPAARSIVRRLRRLGVRKIPRGPRPATLGNPANLTRRQVEVTQLLAEGLTNAEIAERLFISAKTAGHHVSAVLAKLGVGTRTEAVRAAIRIGIVPGDDDAAVSRGPSEQRKPINDPGLPLPRE